MDYLTSLGLEPQLAIPVLGVVLLAVLVYIFGFQKTEEPSYEHLAVLQSTYKSKSGSGLKQKSSSSGASQTPKNASKAKDKPISNGHVIQEKEKNGSVKQGKALNGLNKENKPPQNVKNTPTTKKEKKVAQPKPADFEEGDWIQAVSRKDKKNRVKKDEPQPKSSPRKEKLDADEAWESVVLKEVESSQVTNQTTQTTPLPSPEKKGKSSKSTTTAKESSDSSSEPSPVKQRGAAKIEKADSVDVDDKKRSAAAEEPKSAAKENVEPAAAESPKKKSVANIEESVPANDPKNNVAFDEMAGTASDIWEEAKSRGTKKRRSRKD